MKFQDASKELETVLTTQSTVTVKKLKKILSVLNISNKGTVRSSDSKVLKERIRELEAKVKHQASTLKREHQGRMQMKAENEQLKSEVARLREEKAQEKG